MAEWPEEKLLGREGPDGPLFNPDEMFHSGDPQEEVETQTYVPKARLEILREIAQARLGRAQQAEAQLAECYRLSGADPDGDDDSMLAQHAVQAVKELREEGEEEGDRADQLQAILDALVGEEALGAFVEALMTPDGDWRDGMEASLRVAKAAAK